MGIFGAVLATCLAPLISLLLLSPHLARKNNRFHLTKCLPAWTQLWRVFVSGVPSLVTEVSSVIVILVFNILILDLEGNLGVAAYGIIANLSLVVVSVYTGIAQGIQPITAHRYGTGAHGQVLAILRYAMVTMLTLSAFLYAGMFFSRSLSAAFSTKSKTKGFSRLPWKAYGFILQPARLPGLTSSFPLG